jgi:CHAD domain-containing protein
MISKLQKMKLKEFNKYVKLFVIEKRDSVEDVHRLRLKARELYSLLDTGEPFYAELKSTIKKILKITNQVRDVDVFLGEYITLLPHDYSAKLDLDLIQKDTQKERSKDIKLLHRYLFHIKSTKALKFDYEKSLFSLEDKKQLHKYRIYIKKSLYHEKNNLIRDERMIEVLTNIKDSLGAINDNYNAIKRLESFDVDKKLLKKIKKETLQRDKVLFEEFIYFNSLL